MDFNSAKDLIMIGMLGIGVGLLGWIAKSVSDLNTKIAVVIFRQDKHDVEIVEIKQEIKELRDKCDEHH